jgi:hypothetical protein
MEENGLAFRTRAVKNPSIKILYYLSEEIKTAMKIFELSIIANGLTTLLFAFGSWATVTVHVLSMIACNEA